MKNKLIGILVACSFGLTAYGLPEVYSVRHSKTELDQGTPLRVEDGKFLELGSTTNGFYDYGTELRVKLGVDERASYGYIPTALFPFSLDITVQAFNNSGTAVNSPIQRTLTVEYDYLESKLINTSIFLHSDNRYKYEISYLVGSATVPDNVYLEAELEIDRYYEISELKTDLGANYVFYDVLGIPSKSNDINKQTIPSNTSLGYNTGQELEIWWDYIEGAEDYELEWTWVDNYSAVEGNVIGFSGVKLSERDFELNNTRIITNKQHYKIPLIYAKGYLVYRVRGVGRWLGSHVAKNTKKFGPWTTVNKQLAVVGDWPHFVRISSTHEALKNWQFQAVYAEEGKKKEIVNYFDGSLRNRQTVTKINSNNEAIVGENVYDNQGRSAVQILPTPVGNPSLRYYPALNQNAAGEIFTHQDFDWDPASSCVPTAMPMLNTSGASKYYSDGTVNPVENNWQDQVPNANGFPYVQVEYTPDNTGRINKQSGVGDTYKIDGDHTTRYFYGQPYQEELDRLFGYEVGYKSRYKKNMVVDANGQVSVSYLDPQGRVVATALAGAANGTGLTALDEETNGVHGIFTVDLLGKTDPDDEDRPWDDNIPYSSGNNGFNTDGLRFGTQTISTKTNNEHSFVYRIRTEEFDDGCLPNGETFPYQYVLDLDVKDECAATVLGQVDKTSNGTTTTSTGAIYETILGNSDISYDFTSYLDIGSYTTGKNLTVDPVKLEEYATWYVNNNTCLETETVFFQNNVDPDVGCDDVLPLDLQIEVNNCMIADQMMLADLSPSGQYGSYDPSAPNDLLSVFSPENALNGGVITTSPSWKLPFTPYEDNSGNTSLVTVIYNSNNTLDPFTPAIDVSIGDPALIGTNIPNQYEIAPEHLYDVEDFLAIWENSWSKSLLEYHPEYCYAQYCNQLCEMTTAGCGNISSDNYDATLQSIMTYADAQASVFGNLTNPVNTKNNDPFFCLTYDFAFGGHSNTAINTFQNTLMDDVLLDFKNLGASPSGLSMNLWEFAMSTVVCGTNFSGTCNPSSISINSLSTAQQDQIWSMYKSLYVAEKKKITQLFINYATIANDCYNGYIGDPVQTHTLVQSFDDYPGISASLVDYMDDAIAAASGSGQFPWLGSLPDRRDLFTDKIKRYIPIDDLYDSSVPDAVSVSNGTINSNQQMYAATGRCDLSFDVEALLNGLATANPSTLLGVTNSNLAPYFTKDLYEAMGGTVMPSGGSVVNITGITNGNILLVGANDAAGLNSLSTISLTKLSGTNWSWSDVRGFSMLYYVPNSLSGGLYTFQVLAQVDDPIDGMIEVVLYGTTSVAIGECNTSAACERPDELGDNLGVIFSELHDQQELNGVGGYNGSVSSLIGSWYAGSELATQMNDGTANATLTSSLGAFTITNGTKSINVNFTNYNAGIIDLITGFTFTENNGVYQLEVFFVNTSGVAESIVASVIYDDYSLFNLSCGCEGEITAFENKYALMINDLINAINSNSTGSVSNYSANVLDNLAPYIANGSNNVEIEYAFMDGYLHYELAGDNSCIIEFYFADPVPSGVFVLDMLSVQDVEITLANTAAPQAIIGIRFTGNFPNGQQYLLESVGTACMQITTPCASCVPTTVAPQSCTAEFVAYHNTINTLNVGAQTLIPTFEEDDFCNQNLAYSTPGYLHYLSQLNITSTTDDFYITIGQFSNTALNAGYTDINSVIDQFDTYRIGKTPSEINWNTYVNDVFMALNDDVCPPLPLPSTIDIELLEEPCDPLTANIDIVNASSQYDIYINNAIADFKQRYIEGAMSSVKENFNLTQEDKEYHYTLYYYDQAGNLVQTVPPKGVERIEQTEMDVAGIVAARTNNTTPDNSSSTIDVVPDPDYNTLYRYNSLNQLVWQKTPDGGESNFAYDVLGRLVVSQNAKQLTNNAVSYTIYDELGRIVEVGELTLNSANYNFDNGQLKNGNTVVQLSDIPTDVIPAPALVNFPLNITNQDRREVTKTMYDEMDNNIAALGVLVKFKDYSEYNTRNRIIGVMYYDTYGTSTTIINYQSGTFYDYDVHGNVKELIQDIREPDLVLMVQNMKSTQYEYDLVSGNVKEVVYQEEAVDQFVHRYCYDADNRITIAETSKDKVVWEKDAKYFYYDHGPLARVEIGDKKVQALDYAYTIQGWLKGVNSENLLTSTDQGLDGQSGTINQMNGKDVMGYSLHYFDGDYQGRQGNNFLALSELPVIGADLSQNLYNGNIKEMFTASTKTNQDYLGTSHTWYEYDQLNRIKDMKQQELDNVASAYNNTDGYASTYSFDANGNLEDLTRTVPFTITSDPNGVIDDFEYFYDDVNKNNRLHYVDDAVPVTPLPNDLKTDLEDQSTYDQNGDPAYLLNSSNYAYDAIGQLIQDKQEEITTIDWMVTGKVKAITRKAGSTKENLSFDYDAMGNRITKTVYDAVGNPATKTFYFRDAQGNAMSTYTYQINDGSPANASGHSNLYLSERNIYGSSRVGMEQVNQIVASIDPSGLLSLTNNTINSENDALNNITVQQIGDKRYELSNHLGNVLEVISDKKLAEETFSGSGILAYYIPDVISQSDYYPYGMLLPGRNESSAYRYGFNGKEKDDEVSGEGNIYDYGFRIYNPRLGKFLSLDPLADSYPWYTPYQFAGNKPIVAIDLDGLEEFTVVAQGAPIPDPSNPNQTIQPVVIYWDITARDRPLVDASGNPVPNSTQRGTIQYVDADRVSNMIRPLTPAESATSYIEERVAISKGSMQEKILKDNPNATRTTEEGYRQTELKRRGAGMTNITLTPPPALGFTPLFTPNTPVVANPRTLAAQAATNAPNLQVALAGSPTNMVNVQANGRFPPGTPGSTSIPQPGGGSLTINQIMAGRGQAIANALVAAGIPRGRINILAPNPFAGAVNVNVNVNRNNRATIEESGELQVEGNQGPRRDISEAGTPLPSSTQAYPEKRD